MEIREEYRPEIQRELTAHEQKLWTFRPSWSAPDVLAIREPSSEEKLYHHSQIDEEAENFYKLADANYFTKRYKKQIEKEQTWGFFLTDEGGVYVKPLERPLYWQAREFVKMFFIPNDPLWSFFKFESDNEAYTDLMRIIKDWITSAQSVIAINPRKKKLHGVALGCYNDGTYLSKKISQVQSFSAKVTELMNMRRFFQKKITSSMRFWNKNYYQIELLSVDDTFPEKQVPALLRGLILGCLAVAKHLNAAWVFGLSTQKAHHDAYEGCDFEKVTTFPLYSWTLRDGHIADYRNSDLAKTLRVYVKELTPNPNLKWMYYKKLHDE